jgi:acyl-CoA reductase-like NAD-dependent aldehyde dehydrogenase
VGEETQTPDDYIRQLSSTTGLPATLVRANMKKTHFVLDQMERVLTGLTRGLDLAALDRGWTDQDDRCTSFRAETDNLGAVLPSNSPGVHSLWIPAVGLKIPLVLKPGRQEPWTPYRVAQALFAAGCPREAVSFYPTSYDGAAQILLGCGRSMLFGDVGTVRPWQGDPRVELHGPGWSKVVLGPDQVSRWQEHLETLASSVADNGGRSCINASGVWLPRGEVGRGRALAEALARRLGNIRALPLDHPEAGLAAFSDPSMAHRISKLIDSHLRQGGAEDVSARLRTGRGEDPDRVVEVGGCTFLLPTVIHCDSPDHPLASTELLFPFVSVVEVAPEELLERLGPTLVATGLTEDPGFSQELLACRSIERLNLGEIPTTRVSWDQPHEGNLFDHLYRQRALQGVVA